MFANIFSSFHIFSNVSFLKNFKFFSYYVLDIFLQIIHFSSDFFSPLFTIRKQQQNRGETTKKRRTANSL